MAPTGDRRPRRGLPLWLLLAVAAAPAGLVPASRALAVPIDDPHVGGIGFSGPTTGDLAAVYWNPAALGLMRGLNVMVAGTAQRATTTVARTPIDPATGQPRADGALTPGEARAADERQPFTWPPGPGAFAGISYDVGGDRFTLAFATFMPFLERTSYTAPGGGALATRYHRISADLRNLALVPALSVRFAGDFRLGFAPGFLFSSGRLSFADAVCGGAGACPVGEDPASDAHFDLGSRGMGLGSARFAVTLGGGLYYRRRGWEMGVSFSSRPLGGDISGAAVIAGDRSTVSRDGGGAPCPPGSQTVGQRCLFPVYADVSYKLPSTIAAAVSWRVRPGMELATILRILAFSDGDRVDIRLTGPTLADAGLPEHVVFHRGYRTAFDGRLRFSAWLGERLRVGAALRLESGALPAREVSPAAVDGLKLQPMAMLLFSPVRHLWIGAGYGFTYMFPVKTGDSIFDPGAAGACEAAGGDLGDESCVERRLGRAHPTAAGTYRRHLHSFSLSVTTQF